MRFRHLLLALAASATVCQAYACVIRQSDAIELQLGPFVDSTDGVTAETALTISQADVRISKCAAAGDCGAWAQVNESTSAAHGENGWYEKDFDATDTNTVGILQIAVHESGALPVFKECLVVETAIYDDIYTDGALGLAKAAALDTVDNFVDTEVAAILSDTNAILVDTSTTLDDFIDTEIASLVTAVDNVDNFVDTEIADIRRAIGPATTTIASLSSQTSFTLTAGSADDNAYNGYGLVVIDASTATQTALGCVLDYTGASKTITLNADPGVFTMAATDNVVLLPAYCTTVGSGLDAAGVRAAVGLASANLDTQLSTIDDYVDTEVAAILVDTGTTLDDFLDTEVAAILSDTNAILVDTSTTLDDFLDTEVAAILAAVDTEVADIPTNAELATALGTADDAVLAAIAALNNLSSAQVRDLVIEDQGGGVSLGCAISVVLAYAAGDLVTAGAASTYEDPSGTETRATGTVASAGNRTAAITCPTY